MIVAYSVIYDDMGRVYCAFESQSEQDAFDIVVPIAWHRPGWTACIFIRDTNGKYTVTTYTDKIPAAKLREKLIEKAWQEIDRQFSPPKGPKRF